MVNDSLREACADILEALAKPHNGDPRRVGQLMRGARTLRWAERHEYGDPVPADMVQARIDAAVAEVERDIEGEIDDAISDAVAEANVARGVAEREVEALRALVAPSKLAVYDKRKAARR